MNILIARAAEYTLIAPLPGSDAAAGENFTTYLQALFPFLLSAAAVLAFVMIVLGGIFYVTSGGNPSTVGSAKDRIQAAIIGLLIAAISYLIINAINPKLLALDFSGSIEKIETSTPPLDEQKFFCASEFKNLSSGEVKTKKTLVSEEYCEEFCNKSAQQELVEDLNIEIISAGCVIE